MKQHGSRVVGSLISLLLLTACSQSPTIEPTPTNNQTPTNSAPESALALYFVADTAQGLRLYREFRRVPVEHTNMEAALRIVLEGAKPRDPDYTNLWPQGSVLNRVAVSGNTAVIDLSFSALNVGSEGELRAIDQLVWTATAADTNVSQVRFLRDGKEVESFAGHVDTRGLFKREASYEVLAPVWITSADEGATISRPLIIGGLAQVFEANVQWQVLKGREVAAQGATLAAEAAPARTPWEVRVSDLPPGTYTIRAFVSSPKDGALIAEDTKTVNLR